MSNRWGGKKLANLINSVRNIGSRNRQILMGTNQGPIVSRILIKRATTNKGSVCSKRSRHGLGIEKNGARDDVVSILCLDEKQACGMMSSLKPKKVVQTPETLNSKFCMQPSNE